MILEGMVMKISLGIPRISLSGRTSRIIIVHTSSPPGPCKSAVPMNTSFDCFQPCGSKGGLCEFCGVGGFCCHRDRTDCHPDLAALAKQGAHTCIVCTAQGMSCTDTLFLGTSL